MIKVYSIYKKVKFIRIKYWRHYIWNQCKNMNLNNGLKVQNTFSAWNLLFALLLTLKIFLLSIYHQMDDACEPFELCIPTFSFSNEQNNFCVHLKHDFQRVGHFPCNSRLMRVPRYAKTHICLSSIYSSMIDMRKVKALVHYSVLRKHF